MPLQAHVWLEPSAPDAAGPPRSPSARRSARSAAGSRNCRGSIPISAATEIYGSTSSTKIVERGSSGQRLAAGARSELDDLTSIKSQPYPARTMDDELLTTLQGPLRRLPAADRRPARRAPVRRRRVKRRARALAWDGGPPPQAPPSLWSRLVARKPPVRRILAVPRATPRGWPPDRRAGADDGARRAPPRPRRSAAPGVRSRGAPQLHRGRPARFHPGPGEEEARRAALPAGALLHR